MFHRLSDSPNTIGANGLQACTWPRWPIGGLMCPHFPMAAPVASALPDRVGVPQWPLQGAPSLTPCPGSFLVLSLGQILGAVSQALWPLHGGGTVRRGCVHYAVCQGWTEMLGAWSLGMKPWQGVDPPGSQSSPRSGAVGWGDGAGACLVPRPTSFSSPLTSAGYSLVPPRFISFVVL